MMNRRLQAAIINVSTNATYLLLKLLLIIAPLLFACSSCTDGQTATTPKPKGYFRIALPEKKFQTYNESCPFTFEYPVYSKIENEDSPLAQPCWININYTNFHAKLHLSYKHVNNNLTDYLEESRKLAIQHQVKANAMRESPIINPKAKVYGLIYEFGGNTASSIQFYLTDSSTHFMRGALYFFAPPNSDSIAPAYQFLKKDIYHFIETLEWRKDIPAPLLKKVETKK